MLNPDKVTHVHYWCGHESFSDEKKREAAESVAARVLEPILRSRGNVSKNAKNILKDQGFCDEMDRLFGGDPDGVYQHPTVDNLADIMGELHTLHKRVSELEKKLKEKGN